MKKWKVSQLGDIAKITMGHSPASAHYNTQGIGLPLIQGNADVNNFRRTYIRNWTSVITNSCDKDDIIMSVRAPAGAVAKASYASCIGRGVCSIKYENDYIYHYLIFKEQEWKKKSAGSTFDSVTGSEVKKFEIHHPVDNADQQKIAAVLSDIDALIEIQEALIAKKMDIKAATMELLLTGKKRLPGFSGEWSINTIGKSLSSPPIYGINAAACESRDGLHPYIRITDIDENYNYTDKKKVAVNSQFANNYLLLQGDIVVARTGASVGKSCIYDQSYGPLVYAGFLIKLTPNASILLPKYLALTLQTPEYWRWIKENSMRSGQPGINAQQLSSFKFKKPPLNEQLKIVENLSSLENELALLNMELVKLVQNKDAVMHKLLTGEIRLP